ncbi:MAG: glycosyltransferase [Bacteroidales bacterium]|nr:glycosyltransferase [Bacteroidales bacterium]
MPRVLRIINRFNLGGPTYNAANLTKYMEPEFETLLLGGMRDETEDSSEFILDNLGISPIIIDEMRREISPKNDLIAYKKIKKIIKEFKPDIVHTHAAKAGTIGRLAAYNCKVPVVVHTFHGHVFHSYFNSYKSSIFKKIERNLAKKTNMIIAVSENQRLELANTYKITALDKIRVIPLGFNLSRFRENMDKKRLEFRETYRIQDDEIAIGIVGRLVPIKNHNFFLDAIQRLRMKSNKKIRVFVVGDGESRESLLTKAEELNLDYVCNGQSKLRSATVTFTSWIKEVDYVYAGMDIIALTSLNEGTPVSLIEAQAAGKAIISTNVGGIENIVIPGETALLTNNGNIKEFSTKLIELVNNDLLRESIAGKGWDYVRERFHFETLVGNMKNLYYELLNSKT